MKNAGQIDSARPLARMYTPRLIIRHAIQTREAGILMRLRTFLVVLTLPADPASMACSSLRGGLHVIDGSATMDSC
jgi:hypothetical protein